MGIRTDLTSLGAIGLGTAVAFAGTGALLFAGTSHTVDVNVGSCVDVPAIATLAALPAVPEAPEPHRVSVVVSDRIEVRTECLTDLGARIEAVRVRARAQAGEARARAAEVRVRAEELRVRAEEIRAEALESGEVDAERIQELVEAALEDAGIRRGGSWGN